MVYALRNESHNPRNRKAFTMFSSTTTMMNLPWMTQFSSCAYWSLTSCVHDTTCYNDRDEPKSKLRSSDSTLTSITATSSSTASFPENNSMVLKHRRQRFKAHPSTTRPATTSKNQLVKPVSPFAELSHKTLNVIDDYSCPFDELIIPVVIHPPIHDQTRHEDADRRHHDQGRRDGAIPPQIRCETVIPTTVVVPSTMDDLSECSHDAFDTEIRTLTPHPSFDEPKTHRMTAHDFHYLYQATQKLEEQQDWPSDEDVPLNRRTVEGDGWWSDGSNYSRRSTSKRNASLKKAATRTVLKDLDESLFRRHKRTSSTYRLV